MISLSQSNNKTSQIDKKESKNKFIDKMRSMMTSLSQSINKKIMQIDKKVSESDKKISQAVLIEQFPNRYQLCN